MLTANAGGYMRDNVNVTLTVKLKDNVAAFSNLTFLIFRKNFSFQISNFKNEGYSGVPSSLPVRSFFKKLQHSESLIKERWIQNCFAFLKLPILLDIFEYLDSKLKKPKSSKIHFDFKVALKTYSWRLIEH